MTFDPFFLLPEDPSPVLLRHNSTPLCEPDPPTPLTTTLYHICQSLLAKVQQKRTRYNVLAGKHPLVNLL
jgi:hypothetical protein